MGITVIVGVAVAVIFAVLYVIDFIQRMSKDPREPPTIWHPFPLIGHVYGIVRIGANPYVSKIGYHTSAAMFTLDFLFARLYVTNSAHANAVVQRNAPTVSFRPFKKVLMKNIAGVSPHTLALYDEGGRAEGDGAFVKEMDKYVLAGLAAGPSLDMLITRMGEAVTKRLDTVNEFEAVGMMQWVRPTVTLAVSSAIYGANNPYNSKECIEAFWTADKYKMIFTTGLPPWIFARGGMHARDKLLGFFEDFFRNNGPETGSDVTKGRYAMYTKHNLSITEMAKLELSTSFGLFPNIIPTSFWTLYEIFSRPALLEELRAEVHDAVIIKKDDTTGKAEFSLSISELRNCKLLISTFQETQRIRSRAAGIRQVMSDTTIEASGQSFLLKKGSFVQIPSEAIHNDPALWGANSRTFDPYRFMKADSGEGGSKIPRGSFIPFGYAPSVCPGRQFAATEIMTLVAMTVLRYDLVPVSGHWTPLASDLKEPVTLCPPKGDIKVNFKSRDGWRGAWNVELGNAKTTFKLASG